MESATRSGKLTPLGDPTNDPLKIGVVEFHQSFNARDYSIVRLLRDHFVLDIVDTSTGEVPDFLETVFQNTYHV